MSKYIVIDSDKLIDAVEETDWYHLYKGELIHGANSNDDEPLFKANDIFAILDKLEKEYTVTGIVCCGQCDCKDNNKVVKDLSGKVAVYWCRANNKYVTPDFFCAYGGKGTEEW